MPAEMSLFAAPETEPVAMPPARTTPTPPEAEEPPGKPPQPPQPLRPIATPAGPPAPTSPPVNLPIEAGKLLLTEREAAKALSICPRTLWQLRTDGEIPCIRVGRAVRYDPADLRAWVARNRR